MSKHITFRMHAYSDAAGKTNPEAVRGGNEDNFYVDDNLSDEFPSHCESDVVKELGEYGLIMAVADGMGGMNAGEVASEIAVNTVQEFFGPGQINEENSNSHNARKKYLEHVIVEADARIKQNSRNNPDHEGMGSTIILAWVFGNELTLSWCGDSRAYRFNPATGIQLISEDHSYVQELVKKGVLTYEQTFEHPQGNIVTRSLGDESKRAQPETRFFNVYDGDIILLCSDGLSGVLRDRKTYDGAGGYFPGDNLEDLIRNNSATMVGCREALWAAAEKADWYDNVTAILCEIISGAGPAPRVPVYDENPVDDSEVAPSEKPFWSRTIVHVTPKSLTSLLVVIAILIGCVFAYKPLKEKLSHQRPDKENVDLVKDTNSVVQPRDSSKTKLINDQPAQTGSQKDSKGNSATQTERADKTGKTSDDNQGGNNTIKERVNSINQANGTTNPVELTPATPPTVASPVEAEGENPNNPIGDGGVAEGEIKEKFMLVEWEVESGQTVHGFKKELDDNWNWLLLNKEYSPQKENKIEAGKIYYFLGMKNSQKFDDFKKLFSTEVTVSKRSGDSISIQEGFEVSDILKKVENNKVYVILGPKAQ